MANKRKEDGFNLAFLDVMACGLGAVLMILIVVKFNANTSVPTEELERLQQELAALQNNAVNVQKSIDEVNDNIAMESNTIDAIKQQINALKVQQDATKSALEDKLAVVADLEQSIAAAAPEQSDDLIELKGSGEEKYLLGLKVEGKRIGILLDMSASMTDELLLDIIKRKIKNDSVKKLGPKWLRSKRIVKWMIARLPKDAQVTIVAFNDTARVLGNRSVNSASVSASLNAILGDLEDLIPKNGTNLQVGLKTIRQEMPNMTNLYVITDGLPTLLNKGSGFAESRKCTPSTGSSKTITGLCRFQVFQYTFVNDAPPLPTNIVLLPLEGDTQAPSAYWNWANASGGLMISPAGTWP